FRMDTGIGKRHQALDVPPERQRGRPALAPAALQESRENLLAPAFRSRFAVIAGPADKAGCPCRRLEIERFAPQETFDSRIAVVGDMNPEIVDREVKFARRHQFTS